MFFGLQHLQLYEHNVPKINECDKTVKVTQHYSIDIRTYYEFEIKQNYLKEFLLRDAVLDQI